MKKFLSTLLAMLMLLSIFASCDSNEQESTTNQQSNSNTETESIIENDSTQESQTIARLTTPTVVLVGNIAAWNTVENADRLEISINGELFYLESTVTNRTLEDGQTFKIRAIGDGVNYLTSDWSNTVTYTAGTENSTEDSSETRPETSAEDNTLESTETLTEAPTEDNTEESAGDTSETLTEAENPDETSTGTSSETTTEPTTEPNADPTYQEKTISFANTSARTSINASTEGSQVWSANGVTLTNTGHVADYCNPVRLYKYTSVSIACNGMVKIVFACFSEAYATELVSSLGSNSNFTVTADGKTVSVKFKTAVNEFTFTCSTSQIRLDSLTVTAPGSGSSGGSQGGGGQGSTTPSTHTYTDFTSDEKALFTQYIGEIVPFIPNDEYYVEGYYDETGYEYGMHFYTFGNTETEFNAYRNKFSSYELYEVYEDEYGDTYYCYIKNDDVVVDVSFYYYEGNYVVDLYVYSLSLSLDDEGGDDGDYDDSGSGSTTPSDVDLITNDGKGLPEGEDGIFNVDFTTADKVKDVTDQGYYLDGCPTTGSPAVLVIPVEFSDITAQSKGYSIENITKIFNGTGNDTIYYSVDEYFKKASYGALDLDITVLDQWFKPENTSTYYATATYDYYDSEIAIGDQLILDEALEYLEDHMDLSIYDSDNNGFIDAVVLVTTLTINKGEDFYWAYRYWNVYTGDDGNYYEYDSVSANDFAWIPYQFMFEDSNGGYTNTDSLNPYTFIHEFSHVLGADDYYDTAYVEHPLDGYDMMDGMIGDHNPYTKFNYGWITTSKLIVADSAVTVTLDAFVNSGDTVILANNWDENLGVYQEYFVIMYYKNEGLNSGEGGFFEEDGIIVFHINASLYSEEDNGQTYYDVYFNNTDASDQYGTEENLIEYVKSGDGDFTYTEDETLPEVRDDAGNVLGYTFTVDSISESSATLTFTKVA